MNAFFKDIFGMFICVYIDICLIVSLYVSIHLYLCI